MSRVAGRIAAFWTARATIQAMSLFVPRQVRIEWRAEWLGELGALCKTIEGQHSQVILFAFGCVPDAFTIRKLAFETTRERRFDLLDSPLVCIATLSSVFVFSCGALWTVRGYTGLDVETVAGHLGLAGLAIVCSVATSRQPSADGSRYGNPGTLQFCSLPCCRRMAFMILKAFFVLGAAGIGATLLLTWTSHGSIQMHGYLIPYLVAGRWCASDESRRCPVCGWLTSHPVRIGTGTSVFLNWSGSERICRHGHGLLYESGSHCIAAPLRWISLDPSWAALFRSSRDSR
jgi:hypothetical protein